MHANQLEKVQFKRNSDLYQHNNNRQIDSWMFEIKIKIKVKIKIKIFYQIWMFNISECSVWKL